MALAPGTTLREMPIRCEELEDPELRPTTVGGIWEGILTLEQEFPPLD